MKRSIIGILSAAALTATVPTLALAEARSEQVAITTPAGPTRPVIVRHKGVFNDKPVVYDSVVEPIVVNDASGKPGATIVGISYIAAGAGDPAKRPVLFVFNGGPIGPSAILHMGAFGPKRVAIPDDLKADPSTFKVVDNGYTVLDVADLVFFDPASTGWSRVQPGVEPKSYFSNTADGQQLAQFIVEWCKAHHRMASPKYVLGESYGTMRAASTANQLQKMAEPQDHLAGVVLLGQALNIIEFSQRPTNVMSYVVSLPTLAAIAWDQNVADRKGRSFETFEADARAFADGEYLTGLYQGSSLDLKERRRIADRLQEFTGLSADWYLANDLKISKERYRRELFRDKGEILGMTDARYVGPADAKGNGEPAGVVSRAYQKAFDSYVHSDLGVGDVGPYLHEDPVTGGLDGWNWGHGASPFSDWPYPRLLTEVFQANPKFRVMVGNGWEDTQTTVGAARLLVNQSGWPRDRTSLHFYEGGHMSYSVEASEKRLTDDVRAFLTSGS